MLHTQTDTTPSRGNALQACVASLLGLEMEAVPNFVAAPEGYWDAMLAHAASLGLSLIKVPLTDGRFAFPSVPRTRCLARGDSPRGAHGHVVLATTGLQTQAVQPWRQWVEAGRVPGPAQRRVAICSAHNARST